MSSTDKTFTVKINTELGNSVQALKAVEQTLANTGVVLKELATISNRTFDGLTDKVVTTHQYIARITASTTESIKQAKQLLNSLAGATPSSSRTILIGEAEKLAAEQQRIAKFNADQILRIKREQLAEEKVLEAQRKATLREQERVAKFNSDQILRINKERLVEEKRLEREREALYSQRNKIFQSTLSEATSKLRNDIAIQKAIQQEGANSITAIKLQQAEKERQIERKLQADLALINKQFQQGNINWIQSAAQRNTLLNTSRESILRLNQATLNHISTIQQLTNTNSLLELSQRNLIVRAAEFIGIYRILNSVLNTVSNALRAIPRVGIEVEATFASLSATVGTGGTDSVMKALTKEAERAGISIQTVRENFRTFQASASLAGETLKDVWTIFTNLNTTATALHLSTDKVQLTFLAISQIFNKTKVQSEELVKQLGNLLPGAFASFVQANKRVEESTQQASLRIVKAMKAGTVLAHDTILNFTNFYANRFAVAFDSASNGLNANFHRMQNSFQLLGEAIYNTTGGPLLSITKGITTFTNAITDTVKGSNALGKNFDTVLNVALAAGVVYLGNLILGLESVRKAMLATEVATAALNASIIAGTAHTTAWTATLGVLKGAFAFLSSPTVLIAGLVLIGKYFYDLKQDAKDLAESIDSTFERLAKKAAAKTPAQKLQLEVDENIDVKATKAALDKIRKIVTDAQKNLPERNLLGIISKVEQQQAQDNIVRLDKAEKNYLETRRRITEDIKLRMKLEEEAAFTTGVPVEGTGVTDKQARDEYRDILRDSKLLATSIHNQIEELTTNIRERLSSAEKGTYNEQFALVKEFYAKKISLIEMETAVQLEALYRAKDIAAQRHDIAKQQEFDDRITALAGKPASGDTPAIYGSGDAAEIAAKKELHALQKQIDDDEINTKQKLLQATDSAQKAYENSVAQLNMLYDSLNSKGDAVITKFEYAAALTKINTTFNIAKDKELSAPVEKAVPALARYYEGIKKVNKETRSLGVTSNDVYNASLKGVNVLMGSLESMLKTRQKLKDAQEEEQKSYSGAVEGILISKYDDETKRAEDLHNLKLSHAIELGKIEAANLDDNLTGARQMVASASKYFDQKSAAAKALFVLEQGIALTQLGMTFAQTNAETAQLGVKGAAAVLNQGQGDPYSAFARIAAMIGIVAGIISAVGGSFGASGGSKTYSPTTGQSPTTGTVLGDPGKSSESLQNVTDMLENIHAKEYKELKGINDGVTLMSKGISNALTRAYQVPGAGSGVYDPAGLTGSSKSSSNLAGKALTLGGDHLLGGKIGNFLFGGKITKEIVAGGITTAGVEMANLLAGSLVGAAQYSIIETTKKGGLLTKTKKSIDTILTQIDPQIQESFTSIYRSVGVTLLSLSDSLGLGFEESIKKSVIPSITVALRGLSSEEAGKTLNAAISTLIDNLTTTLFGPIVEQYQKLGEGTFETLSRLAIDVGVVKNSFNLIGAQFKETGVEAIAFAESMVSVTGSIEDLRGAFEQFFSDFLSQQEQEQHNYESLSASLVDMNLILPSTREEWKALVQTMLAGGNATATTAANLLLLGKNADSYYKTLEKSQSELLTTFFGESSKNAFDIAANSVKQQKLIAENPSFRTIGFKPGDTSSDVQAAIASYLQQANITMEELLARIVKYPDLRPAIDAFVALAASNSSATPDTKDTALKELNQEAKDITTKFSTEFKTLIGTLLTKLASSITASTPLAGIREAVNATRESYNIAVKDLNNLYATITDNLHNKMFELRDAIQVINNSLIKDATQKAAADLALYSQQKNRLYEQLNKSVAGESAQAMYDRQIGLINNLQGLIQTRYDNEVASIKEVSSAVDGIRSHVKQLLTDTALSPLTNAQRLSQSGTDFQEVISAAKTGNKEALGKVNEALDKYLTEARGFYASSTDYQKLFYSATEQANALTQGQVPVDEQIARATANTVSELQSLQNKVTQIESKKAAELAHYQAELKQSFTTLSQQFLQAIQGLVNKASPGNTIDVGKTYGGTSTAVTAAHPLYSGTPGTPAAALFSSRAAHIDELMKKKDYAGIAKYMLIDNKSSKSDSAIFLNQAYGIPVQDMLQWFTANGFAQGGAFTNGVVQRPTMFNVAQMGESGSEGILPLANIGGKLGVYANTGVSEELLLELRALRTEVAKLREEQNRNTGDLIMTNYDAHSKTVESLSAENKELASKERWLDTSKPALA